MYIVAYYIGKTHCNSKLVHKSKKFKKYPRHSDIVQNEPKDYDFAFVQKV